MPLGFLSGRELCKAIQAYQAGRGSPPNTCASFPHCKEPPLEERAFCDEHQRILDGAKGPGKPKQISSAPAETPEPAPVVVKQTKARPRVRGQAKTDILAALSSGPITPGELRDRVAGYSGNSYRRALAQLVESGKITRSGGHGRSHDARYSLAGDAWLARYRARAQGVDRSKQSVSAA